MAVTESATTVAQRAAIRWQVRTGRYRVDPRLVAEALLHELTLEPRHVRRHSREATSHAS
jgi:anti-sigma28 factor (negative regulator of flagellin synthesis)